MDLGSLQHDGSYALSLTRYFGNLDLQTSSSTNAIFFNIGNKIIVYPQDWAIPLTVLVSILYVGIFLYGRRKKLVSFEKTGVSLLAFILTVAVLGMVSYLFVKIIYVLNPQYYMKEEPIHSYIYRWIIFLIIVVLGVAIFRWISQRLMAVNFDMGAMTAWVILSAVVPILSPGASFLTI